MGNLDIEAIPTRASDDITSLKQPAQVGRAELADSTVPHES